MIPIDNIDDANLEKFDDELNRRGQQDTEIVVDETNQDVGHTIVDSKGEPVELAELNYAEAQEQLKKNKVDSAVEKVSLKPLFEVFQEYDEIEILLSGSQVSELTKGLAQNIEKIVSNQYGNEDDKKTRFGLRQFSEEMTKDIKQPLEDEFKIFEVFQLLENYQRFGKYNTERSQVLENVLKALDEIEFSNDSNKKKLILCYVLFYSDLDYSLLPKIIKKAEEKGIDIKFTKGNFDENPVVVRLITLEEFTKEAKKDPKSLMEYRLDENIGTKIILDLPEEKQEEQQENKQEEQLKEQPKKKTPSKKNKKSFGGTSIG